MSIRVMERSEDLLVRQAAEIGARLQGGNDSLVLTGLFGASKAPILAEISRQAGRPLLVLTPSSAEAELLAADLEFFCRESVGYLPEREENPEIRWQRITCLAGLAAKEVRVAVASIQAALERLSPPGALLGAAITLRLHGQIQRDGLLRALETGGYRLVNQVTDRGECSLRGNLLDIFPPTGDSPVRAEYFGDELVSLREFDPITQRSVRALQETIVLPVVEVPLSADACETALRALRAAEDTQGGRVPFEVTKALEDRRPFPGMDAYLPSFYPDTADLFRYVSPDAILVLADPAGLEARSREIAERCPACGVRRATFGAPRTSHPAPRTTSECSCPLAITAPPFDWADLQTMFSARPQILLEEFSRAGGGEPHPPITFQAGTMPAYRGRLGELARDLDGWRREGRRIHLVCRSEAQGRRLQEVLGQHGLAASIGHATASSGEITILSGELSGGFHLHHLGLAYITEAEIFGPRRVSRRRVMPKEALPFASFHELAYGDFVVHVDHGIGKYKGLRQLAAGGMEGDYLLITYADNAKLYVPTSALQLVHRYLGAGGEPPVLDRLGGTSWARAKERVKASIREMAQALLSLYAARQVISGYAFPPDTTWQREFEAGFPYEETPGQLQAIADVRADMERERPMDRLICGDVGYGKTEVAMRAAFKAVMGGKQVAVLVPTTVLALQHLQTFSERFSGFPIKVEMLSRFRSRKEQTAVLRGVRDGTVDIVIGTHRLLQKDVSFRDLGLLVVDEEHRFGVAAKERLKQLRRQVDALTLSATPIPRTLHMSMLGVRDISTIETPPEDRLSIKTTVARFDPALIQEAIEKELDRGGQVFFVHNRVESIHTIARLIKRLVPRAKLAVAHGELPEARLERIMCDFYAGTFNVLLCTTIIESGLDVGSANTIIIDRADALGLAQLYQLRGRVGRDKRRAYAYLLVPENAALTEVAKKRLQVIAELTELGSGFKVAARDLEIRGAGNLLGPEQHGQIAAVGFDLYCRLIESTVKEVKGEAAAESIEPTIRLDTEGYFPESYVEDPNIRLHLYKRLAALSEPEEVPTFREELIDRFGQLPAQAERLLAAVSFRIQARLLAIREVDARGETIRLVFNDSPPLASAKVAALLSAEADRLRYVPQDTLEYRVNGGDRITLVQSLLARLQECR